MQNLNEKKWDTFPIEAIFKVSGTLTTPPTELVSDGFTPRITCKATNNGLEYCYKNTPTEKGGVLTIDSATIGSIFYQGYDFIATDHVEKIAFEKRIPLSLGLFFQVAITSSVADKYQYGYKFSQKRIAKQTIFLPIDDLGNPNYEYMDQYVISKRGILLDRYKHFIKSEIERLEYKEISSLSEKKFANFLLTDIFSKIQRGKRLKNADHVQGKTPYVSSTAMNNGVDDYITATEGTRTFNDCISLANSGSVGTAFYEPYAFVASDHVTGLKNSKFSKYVYLFLTTILEKQKSNFNFNREINDQRIKKLQVMLPVNDKNDPDYEFMEQYTKNLMLRKYNQYLEYLQKGNK